MDTVLKPEVTIDVEIARALASMNEMPVDSKEYTIAVENLNRLIEARNSKTRFKVSGDMILSAATNILGILLVLNYERLDVVSSKAIGFVLRK